MSSPEEIEQNLRPDDGWWKGGYVGTRIRKIAFRLIQDGMSPEDAEDVMEELIGLIRAEYGE